MFRKKAQNKEEDARVCPFYFDWVGGEASSIKLAKCLKEKCMLWNEEENDCNINIIAKRLSPLSTLTK